MSHTLSISPCRRCGDDVKVHAALGQADGREMSQLARGDWAGAGGGESRRGLRWKPARYLGTVVTVQAVGMWRLPRCGTGI